MDCNSPILDEDTLHQMPYSDLKKLARKRGIMKKRGSMKASKIIAKLMSSVSSDEMDSFSTPVSKELNSSRKNKENQLNEDAMTPLATPRRGTYSIESPTVCILADKVEADSTSSPAKKSPVVDISNVTVLRGSERKLRPRKVSFMSPQRIPRTPTKYISLKDRPKTPVAPKGSSRRASFSTPAPSQSQLKKSKAAGDCDSALKSATKENTATKIKRTATPNFKQIHERAFEKMESIDDYHQRKMKESAKKLAQVSKPKPKVTKAKTKIPVLFSGIPFIPTATSCASLKFNFSSGMPKFTGVKKEALPPQKNTTSVKSGGKRKVAAVNENASLKSKKPKFDLKASLSRKLGYTPYTGPLKPLSESNCPSSPKSACHHGSVKEPMNTLVHVNRKQTRSNLRGVRTNKRFELQMKNRKLE